MRLLWLLATFLVCVVSVPAAIAESNNKIRYDNCKVYKLNIKNNLQLDIISMLENYNIWKGYDNTTREIHIMVKPDENKIFLDLLKLFQIEAEVMINNVQDLIDEEQNATDRSTDNAEFGWKRYHSWDEIQQWLDGILAKYPDVTEGFDIGKSYEGRLIRGIKISYKANNPGIFIESNIHAREWITSATVTWFINELLTSEKAEVRNLAENYDWYIIPVFNVDGFVYSHEWDRMWRKTRQPVSFSNCIGTDANRNFDSHWMENNGASDYACDEKYAGPKPFSEPETRALANYMTSIKDKINVYLSFHSYSQYILSPYGHSTTEFPPNYDDLNAIGKSFAEAIESLEYGTKYQYGSTSTVLYLASGNSVDWVYSTLNIDIGYIIEFRDTGRYGFVLPPVQILPNCQELMAGMLALVSKTKELGYI